MIGLRITDGTTTINLNDGSPWEVEELDLGYGDPSEREISGNIRLLCNTSAYRYGAHISTMSTSIQAIQKLLQQGINYWRNDKGAAIKDSDADIVYLEYSNSTTQADYYRTPITQARYNMPNDSIWSISVGVDEIEYNIDFMRRNWWEGSEAQLFLSTSIVTTKTDSAVTVYNPKPALKATGSTVTFEETGGRYYINDSSGRLAMFIVNSNVAVRGSTSNDGVYQIIASGAAQLEIFQPLVDESPVTVYLMGSEEAEYVQIDGAIDVIGDLPAPVRLAFKNTDPDGEELYELWIGHWFQTGATTNIYEGEDGAYDYYDDLISTAIPPPSEGYLIQYSEVFPGSGELVPVSWTLNSSDLGYYKARYYKAILKLYDDTGDPDDYNYQLRIRNSTSLEIIWEGPIVRYGGYDTNLLARDLGTFRIPPQFSNQLIGSMQNLKLELVLSPYDVSVTNVTGLKIDYLMLLPVDGFRYWKIISGIDYLATGYDDGYQAFAYYILSSFSSMGDVIGRGNQIMLQPGIAQRLYFFLGDDIFKTGAVQLWYRPRRLNI